MFMNTTAVGPSLPIFVSVFVLSDRFICCRQLTRVVRIRPTIPVGIDKTNTRSKEGN